MPPKAKPAQPSKKTVEKKKEKIIEVSNSVLAACLLCTQRIAAFGKKLDRYYTWKRKFL